MWYLGLMTTYEAAITGSHTAPKFAMPLWSNLVQRG